MSGTNAPDAAATPLAHATTTTTVSSPGRAPLTVESAVEVSSAALTQVLERQVGVIQKLAGIPFMAEVKALFVLACLAGGVIAWHQQDAIVAAISRSVERQHEREHATALRDALAQHRTFNVVLGGVRESLHASRALLFQFHNGQSSLKGLPFLFQSETAESVAPGVSNEHDTMQRVPLYVIVDWLPTLLRGECVSQTYAAANSSLQSAMRSVGSEAVYACPVVVPGSTEPAGYVSASYTNGATPPAFADARPRLQEAAGLIGTTLGAYLQDRDQ